MGLLDKFNQIEISPDERICKEDRLFCQNQKQAYDHARVALKAMAELGKKLLAEQREIENEEYGTFLGDFKPGDYVDSLHNSHKRFIARLFSHFRSKYNVTIHEDEAEAVLLPKRPTTSGWSRNEEEWKAYEQTLSDMELDYPAILDQIFVQLGGFSFQDKAIQELKEASRAAAYNRYNGRKEYEQKKAVLTFDRYGCSYDNWYEHWHDECHRITIPDSMKNVIRSLIYFEYGSTNIGYSPLNTLLGYQWETHVNELVVDAEKVKSIKCFKNGRVDVRFTSEAYAREFAAEYLEA